MKKVTTWEERRQTVDLCESCHDHIHSVLTVTQMARIYNTVEKLLEVEEVRKFVDWVKMKPVDFVASHSKAKSRH